MKYNVEHLLDQDAFHCTSCSCCYLCCPVNAISMLPDELAILNPKVDNSKCISCGICVNKCPQLNPVLKALDDQKAFICYRNDSLEKRLISRSGGVFALLASEYIRINGVVYGSICNHYDVSHSRAETEDQIKHMLGSKYTESIIAKTILIQLIDDVDNGRDILFSGLPCQIAMIKSFLSYKKVSTDRILFIDLACHGVVAPKVFHDYILDLENKHGTIKEFLFRDKSYKGWNSHYESFIEKNGKKRYQNKFASLFGFSIVYKRSCYDCQYSSVYRLGDITLADAWGIEQKNRDFFDNNGCSLVLVNTNKGRGYFSKIIPSLKFKEILVEDYLSSSFTKRVDYFNKISALRRKYVSKGYKWISRYCYIKWNFLLLYMNLKHKMAIVLKKARLIK
ncbi:MAG: Coenzyme F420 hydrogenase/dehydrogenase, beta subunit C-terminal domain [Bacilli bacterium]|jgi:coenzyme F420-reducing hydrogenase beta subunit